MTLKQAFTQWAAAPRNTVLAARSREAVQRVLMKQYGDLHLEVFTEAFCRRLFSESSERLELQVKAAAVLVYVLSWVGDHGHCQRPKFTYEIATEEYRKREQAAQQPEAEPKPASNETSNETTMKQKQETPTTTKKPRGHAPRPVVQIDPTTLQPVKEWSSMSEAASQLGCVAGNILRAATQLRTAGGYYWTDPDGVADFKDRLARKKTTPRSQRALASSINRGKRKPTKAEADKPEQTPPSFDEAQGTPAPKRKPEHAEPAEAKPESQQPQEGLYEMFLKEYEYWRKTYRTALPKDTRKGLTPLEIQQERLKTFTDDELSRELKRRGWQGELTKTLSV